MSMVNVGAFMAMLIAVGIFIHIRLCQVPTLWESPRIS